MHSTWRAQAACPRSGMETPWALRQISSYPLVLVSPLISSLELLAANPAMEIVLVPDLVCAKPGLVVSLIRKCGAILARLSSINDGLIWNGLAQPPQRTCYRSICRVGQRYTGRVECALLRLGPASIKTGGIEGHHERDAKRITTRPTMLYSFHYQCFRLR